jgi:hypothetical protein
MAMSALTFRVPTAHESGHTDPTIVGWTPLGRRLASVVRNDRFSAAVGRGGWLHFQGTTGLPTVTTKVRDNALDAPA